MLNRSTENCAQQLINGLARDEAMGTSVNRASPRNLTWQPALHTIGSRVPVTRQSVEIWRSALADRSGALKSELSSETIAQGLQIAGTAATAAEAIARFEQTVSSLRSASLVTDLAHRALVRAVAAGAGAEGYAAGIISEATSYYVSRDLPGVVGAKGRVESTSQAVELKQKIQAAARSVASECAKKYNFGSASAEGSSKVWKKYVTEVSRLLTTASPSKDVL